MLEMEGKVSEFEGYESEISPSICSNYKWQHTATQRLTLIHDKHRVLSGY